MKINNRFDDVLLMTFSEFGRRVSGNASGGTDHGTANNMFMIGGGLKQKGILNPMPDLKDLQDGDLKFKVDFKNVDAVIIPGGWAPDFIRRFKAPVKLVSDAYKAGKVIAAICHAGSVLVSAGILNGKTATAFMAIKDDMAAAGANFVDKEVAIDGNLITSRNPDDLPAFCRAVIAALEQK